MTSLPRGPTPPAPPPCFLAPPPAARRVLPRPGRRPRRPLKRPRACAAAPPAAAATPLSPLSFRGRRVLVKRDDTLRLQGLRGSKARKFRSLTRAGALDGVAALASFGGVQSNAMASLARFASARGLPFVYYAARPVPAHVARAAEGNYAAAVAAGMRVRRVPRAVYEDLFMHLEDGAARAAREGDVRGLFAEAQDWVAGDLRRGGEDGDAIGGKVLFVPQGGAWAGAADGVAELAREICAQLAGLRREGALEYPQKPPILFVGAGTGATAFYLARYLQGTCKVVAVPVAGSADYLLEQMRSLDKIAASGGGRRLGSDVREDAVFPDVLRPKVRSTFADVREGKLLIWKELERAAADAVRSSGCGDLRFDLIYGPKAWEEVWLALEDGRLDGERDLIFLHTGGEEGNVSMLDRFCFKGLLSRAEADVLAQGKEVDTKEMSS